MAAVVAGASTLGAKAFLPGVSGLCWAGCACASTEDLVPEFPCAFSVALAMASAVAVNGVLSAKGLSRVAPSS